jgi:DNA-directed RNA polymerase specialized sigma24 family protein
MADVPELAEPEIRAAFETRDLPLTAQLIFDRYGHDVLGFMIARLHSVEDGREAFASFSEDLWRGLPAFEYRCSARCWVYTLARNAAHRHSLARARRRQRNLPLSQHPSGLAQAATLERRTHPALCTQAKRRVRALRDRLSVQDQTLLMLHVDRGLPWRELAQVLRGTPLDEAALARETVRVRKRFERIKQTLRKLAGQEGIIEA